MIYVVIRANSNRRPLPCARSVPDASGGETISESQSGQTSDRPFSLAASTLIYNVLTDIEVLTLLACLSG